MALAKDRALDDPQARSFFCGGTSFHSLDHPPSLELFGYKSHVGMMLEEGESSETIGNYEDVPILSDTSNYSSSNSSSYAFGGINYQPPQEAHAGGSFRAAGPEHWGCSSSSEVLMSFDQRSQAQCESSYLRIDNEDECTDWNMDEGLDQSYNLTHLDQMKHYYDDSQLSQDQNQFEIACGGYELSNGAFKDTRSHGMHQRAIVAKGIQEAKNLNKRQHKDSTDGTSPKRQCLTSRKSKDKPSSTPCKDPQSIAAKNRRERISEKLKVLQDLVPNGTKVDMVTMLEKAINYVKFLQLQVKVLSTDEFWPTQGGKAPELSQVKDAIDAILSSQRDRNSSSK